MFNTKRNNLHLIRQTPRLDCTWVPTGDSMRPLACVWVSASVAQAMSTVPSSEDAARMHLCA
jgi:hypothetical protein